MDLFSDDNRRNPYPLYQQVRENSPVLRVPPPFDAWLIFDYARGEAGVERAGDVQLGRARAAELVHVCRPAAAHQAAGADHAGVHAAGGRQPGAADRDLSRRLLDEVVGRGEMDLATEYAVPLPMKVIAGMIGIPDEDWPRFRAWSDAILKISYAAERRVGAAQGWPTSAGAAEMSPYLADMVARRRDAPADDLITRLSKPK